MEIKFVLRFQFKSSVHVHSLGQVILRLQHMLLQTFSAGHCKALIEQNRIEKERVIEKLKHRYCQCCLKKQLKTFWHLKPGTSTLNTQSLNHLATSLTWILKLNWDRILEIIYFILHEKIRIFTFRTARECFPSISWVLLIILYI